MKRLKHRPGCRRARAREVPPTLAELAEFLGPIDSPGDAVLAVMLGGIGHLIRCHHGGEVRADPEGFVVFTESGDGCFSDYVHHAVLVRPNGAIETIQREIVQRAPPETCF